MKGGVKKPQEQMLWRDGNVPYLDRCVGYLGVCICENSLNSTLKISIFIIKEN